MYTFDFWHKLDLYRRKIVILTGCLMLASAMSVVGQGKRYVQKNNPNYDDRRFSYGFMIGIHSSAFQLKYSDAFVTDAFDTVYAVHPKWSGGFSLGFIVNLKVEEYLDFRLTPKVSFYDNAVEYVYTDRSVDEQKVESTIVEFPFLAKYKSVRRGNVRMYMIGGITPGIAATGKKSVESTADRLDIEKVNLSLEAGFGFDLYYPLFKFSPEIRFSRGLTNLLSDSETIYNQPLKSVTLNTVTVYLLFQ